MSNCKQLAPRLACTALIALLQLASASIAWPTACADEVDDYIEAQRVEQRIPGLAVLVVKNGQVVKSRGYGLANVEHQVPVTEETIFQLGSVGKQFTATGVMLLVEEGRLGLDDSIRKYLPDAPDNWQSIKVRHLLSHTSGLGDYPDGFDFTRDYTTEQLLQKVYASPRVFEPGEDWRYSNLGYMMLGILIEKVTGKHYGVLLRERIFKPLGMDSTRIISESDIVPHRAAGYRLVQGELKNQKWVAPMLNTTADGSLYVNLLDMAKWDAALTAGKLLNPESLELMWTPAQLNNETPNRGIYGFGWFCDTVANHRVVEHGGAWQGFVSQISRYLDDKLTIVILANISAGSARPLSELDRHIAGIYVASLSIAEAK